MAISKRLRKEMDELIRADAANGNARYCSEQDQTDMESEGKKLPHNHVEINGYVFHLDKSFRDGPGYHYYGPRSRWDADQIRQAARDRRDRIATARIALKALRPDERKEFFR